MITITLYYHISLIAIVVGWVGYKLVAAIIESLPVL